MEHGLTMIAGYVVTGSDPVLRGEVLRDLLRRVVGDEDGSLVVEELTIPGRAQPSGGAGAATSEGGADSGELPSQDRADLVTKALLSATTPPFGTDQRVVVIRDVGNLTTADCLPIIEYLGDPMPTTVMVFVAGGGRLPANLTKAWKAAGFEEVGSGDDQAREVLLAVARRAGVTFTPAAATLIAEHVGEDVGRIPAIVELLASVHGEGARLDADEAEPYLAGSGAVPVYLLTKAIDAGNHVEALVTLDRLRSAGGMHPLQLMTLLHRHYQRLARLDDPEVTGEAEAVAALGGKVKAYPARLAWQQARRIGSEGIRRAITLLAGADIDLRGGSGVPETAVMEVLVTRLAGLTRSQTRRPVGGATNR